MPLDTARFRYSPGRALNDYPTRWETEQDARALVAASVERLAELQELLWADGRHAVLLVFQGMDTAGKDGTIKRVTSGVDPAGFQVVSFRQPSHEDLKHDYLWRYRRAMPERGRIGVFNRSYYEEVLVVRVHPELLESRPLPATPMDDSFWAQRLEDIVAMERHLWRSGTRIVKFFLHLSRAEQTERLLARLRNHEKLWKFDPGDLEERDHWQAHQHAYAEALAGSHREHAPWYVIPADHKWTMRALVAQILIEEIGSMPLRYPAPPAGEAGWVEEAIRRLEADSATPGRR